MRPTFQKQSAVQDLVGDTEHTGCFRWSWWLFFAQNQRPPFCHGQVKRGVCNFGVADLRRLWADNGAGGRRCFTANKFDLSVDPLAVMCHAKHLSQLAREMQLRPITDMPATVVGRQFALPPVALD